MSNTKATAPLRSLKHT